MSKKIEQEPEIDYIYNLKLYYNNLDGKSYVEINASNNFNDYLTCKKSFDDGDDALKYIDETMAEFGWSKSNEE